MYVIVVSVKGNLTCQMLHKFIVHTEHVFEGAGHFEKKKKVEGDWMNILSIIFIALAEASQEKEENIFPTKKSLQCRSFLLF